MNHLTPTTLEKFYQEAALFTGKEVAALLPPGLQKEIGHFNIFDIAQTLEDVKRRAVMPYNRRAYYKISLIRGHSRAEYADKVFDINGNALLFATPRVPYHWVPQDEGLQGAFCIFTADFLHKSKSGVELDSLPLFSPGGYPVFEISGAEAEAVGQIFRKMQAEIASDYAFKYDLLRHYVLELIHYGQKLQPTTRVLPGGQASARVAALFIELLERQFPIESPRQQLALRTAADFASRLSVHVNHLNRSLKESTGKTTSQLIGARIVQEAKILLKQTDWNISEIAWCLGFGELAHFSNFFKKQTALAPGAFRS